MGTKIKRIFRKISLKRTTVLVLAFVLMSVVLVRRLFDLQIIQGQDYISKFEARTTKERDQKNQGEHFGPERRYSGIQCAVLFPDL